MKGCELILAFAIDLGIAADGILKAVTNHVLSVETSSSHI